MVADLELRLEQSEARARSAYTAAEAAEATLRNARDRHLVPSAHSDTEFGELQALLESVTRRADEAERARRTLEADLAALRQGVDPNAVADPLADVAPPHADAWAADPKGSGLRNRLAGAAASKKSRGSDQGRS
jgi:cell division septation protein DedD